MQINEIPQHNTLYFTKETVDGKINHIPFNLGHDADGNPVILPINASGALTFVTGHAGQELERHIRDIFTYGMWVKGVNKTFDIKEGDEVAVAYNGSIIRSKVRHVIPDMKVWAGVKEDRTQFFVLPPDRPDMPGADIKYSVQEIIKKY